MAGPLRQIVVYVNDSQAVKNVAGGFECSWDFRNVTEVEQGGKREPHSSPFIGDQRSTASAADFTWKDSLILQAFAVEESQILDAMGDSEVTLVKDGCPLHRRAMQFLAGQAVAELGIHGVCAHLIVNRPAVAARPVLGDKVLIPGRSVIRSKFVLHGHTNN